MLSSTILNDRNDGTIVVAFNMRSAAPATNPVVSSSTPSAGKGSDFAFFHNDVYTIHPDGTIELHNPSLELPRLGFLIKLPKQLDQFTYYGRGPIDNYPDRKRSQNIGIWKTTVEKEFENFPKPQDMANHQDTRWCTLTDAKGRGALFTADNPMSVSALPWSAQQLQAAPHPYELPPSDGNYLHLDLAITGLGGNSCGQGPPLENDRVKATPHTFSFAIKPTRSQEADLSLSPKLGTSPVPLLITRDAEGNVSITSASTNQDIYYTVTQTPKRPNNKVQSSKFNQRSLSRSGESKVQRYTGPFNLRDGSTVTAYEKSESRLTFSQTFDRIESITVQVMFASSVESGEGDAQHFVDGNPNTYWHTMWSVTVANYPHWVDFDCQTAKNIKGFTYLPRQDSRNGNIKRYRVQVSQDGKTWSEPIIEGEFENNQREKRVLLDKPVKARYLRFTALSSQDGQDFATGAEFTILEN